MTVPHGARSAPAVDFRDGSRVLTLSSVEPGQGERGGAGYLVPVRGRVCGVCGTALGSDDSFVDDDGRVWAVCRSCAGAET